MSLLSRRRFLTRCSVAGAAAAIVPHCIPAKALGLDGATPPSERLVAGGIGLGPRGGHDLSCLLSNKDAQFVAIADLQKSRRQSVKNHVDTFYKNKDCVIYNDMYEVLGRDDIDIVLMATGDRWHTLLSVLAAKAGKDIYCEKPCSMTIDDSRVLADGIRRYGSIYQAGTQRRSIPNFQAAIRLARTGKLGKLTAVHANTLAPLNRNEWLPAQAEPSKDICDWDRWLGPCPWRPFNSSYVNGGWRGFSDFHGAGILEWGSHTIDLCQLAAGADKTTPVEFWSECDYNYRYYESDWGKVMAAPKVNTLYARYANGIKLVMRDGGWLGLGSCSVRFEGEEGWVETGDSGEIRVYPDSLRSELPGTKTVDRSAKTHMRNFLDCVKIRKQTRANADAACQSHIAAHAAYIMAHLGRKLTFDPATDRFINDEEANRMCRRAWREPWHV